MDLTPRTCEKILPQSPQRTQRVGPCGVSSYLSEKIDKADNLTGNIIGATIDVHRALGPGLLESAYEACLVYELRLRQLKVEVQKPLPIFYKDVMIDCSYRLWLSKIR